LAWKARFPEDYQEVVVGPHRADVKGPAAVLEVQRSQIAPEMIREREEFYGEMLWMLKGDDFVERFSTRYLGNGIYRWEWKSPRQRWASAERRLLIDFGEIFEITKIDGRQTPWTGSGRFISGSELYQAVCGQGAELVKHEWYLLNAAQHANRLQQQEAHDQRVEQGLEARRRFWAEREHEQWEREQQRIASDLERQRLEDEARRKSTEEYECYMRERKEHEARQERLRRADEQARTMIADVRWYALEQDRGQIYAEILERRPYPIKDVGCWSTSDLQDLLLSLQRANITAEFCRMVNQQS
jgi:hypothetical protein